MSFTDFALILVLLVEIIILIYAVKIWKFLDGGRDTPGVGTRSRKDDDDD